MKMYQRVYAEIDLDAVVKNMESMRNNLFKGTKIMGVVKADGYGHGSVPIAMTIEPFVEAYAVASIEEAILLRRHGVVKPILVLGMIPESSYEEALCYDIRLTVFQYEKAEKISILARQMGLIGKIHIAVDTGMNRIGLLPNADSADMVAAIRQLRGIEIEGMFTHFAKADETDKNATQEQLDKYEAFVTLLEERGVFIPIKHCANSAGMIDLNLTDQNMSRAGISMYGLYPSSEVDRTRVVLCPAMEWKSFITYIKKIPAGVQVSYGGTFTSEKETAVATVSAGYGDGYPRNLSNRGSVLIHGKRAKIIGRICMDQMMVDVTGIPDAKEDDEVTLIGRDGEESVTVEELAEACGGFHYEILCNIGKRVPRIYRKSGIRIAAKDYFEDVYENFCHFADNSNERL